MREWGAVAEKLVLFVRITFGEREGEKVLYSFFFVQHLLKKELKGTIWCDLCHFLAYNPSPLPLTFERHAVKGQIYLRLVENLMIPSHY
jgi:hypothetical protein